MSTMKFHWRDGALYRPDGSYVASCSWEWAQRCIETVNTAAPDAKPTQLEKR